MVPLIGIIVLLIAGFFVYVQETATNKTGIAGYASTAGFSGVDLDIAVAVALAESGGDPNAVGDVNLGRSIGLWQINLAAHPEYSEDELYDPQTNANAAFAIYQAAGNSFSPWTTFKTGAYQENLSSDSGGSFEAGTDEGNQ